MHPTPPPPPSYELTHLPLVPHLRVTGLDTIGSGNELSPARCQAITWISASSLPLGPLGINFSEIQIKIQKFSFTKMHFKISSAKWRPFSPRGDELVKSRNVSTDYRKESRYIKLLISRTEAHSFGLLTVLGVFCRWVQWQMVYHCTAAVVCNLPLFAIPNLQQSGIWMIQITD